MFATDLYTNLYNLESCNMAPYIKNSSVSSEASDLPYQRVAVVQWLVRWHTIRESVVRIT